MRNREKFAKSLSMLASPSRYTIDEHTMHLIDKPHGSIENSVATTTLITFQQTLQKHACCGE